MQEIAPASRLALLSALAFAPAAFAVSFGTVETRSALGEPLDARIPFQLQQGDEVEASCFALVREPADGPQMLAEGVLTIERHRGGGILQIRTRAPVVEPAIMLRVRTSCPGQGGQMVREYPVLLDPRFEATPSSITSPAIAARLTAGEGETLEGLAAKVHPRSVEARQRYLAALRESNPELAALGDRETIPAGTPIALADLRSLPSRPPPRPRAVTAPVERAPAPATVPGSPQTAASAAPVPAPEATSPPPRQRTERKATPPRLRLSENSNRAAAPAPAKSARRPSRAPAGFALKLSSQEMDLSRSGQVDDRMRAQLRERLLILDADDQVAAMLAMRNSLRQLETRMADMQLKLDSLGSVPARPAAPRPEPARIDPPTVETKPAAQDPKPSPAVEAPKPAQPPAEPKAEDAMPAAAPPKVEAPAAPSAQAPAAAPAPRPQASADSLPSWLWSVVGVLLGLAVLLALWLSRRNRDAHAAGEWANQPEGEDETAEPTIIHEARERADAGDEELNQRMDAPEQADRTQRVPPAREPAPAPVQFEIAAEVRPEIDSDASLATRLKEDSTGLRKRYLEERFPEVQNRTIVLEDPASVVKGARLFYEDGALTRAVELLQFAIEDNPAEVRPWLALFEIFRLERLSGQFAELAERFRGIHGKTEYWRKVQFFGREIDPGNALYREQQVNTLETIGPREAKRLAAGLAITGSSASSIDPITENWLNAPMDFENEVLANELRMSLMAGASLTEQDLVPNPMPALRGVEMFHVG